MDGRLVPNSWETSGAFRITVGIAPPVAFGEIRETDVPPVSHETRVAVYERADDESGVARWLGWDDEFPINEAMVNALCNASDEDVLKLMDDISKLR